MISEFCVYTILHSTKIEGIIESHEGRGSAIERSSWASAERLIEKAKRSGAKLPLLLGAAEKEGGILFYATLDAISIFRDPQGKSETRYEFSNLERLETELPKEALIKISDNKPLSRRYIRPYSLCRTPKEIRSLMVAKRYRDQEQGEVN